MAEQTTINSDDVVSVTPAQREYAPPVERMNRLPPPESLLNRTGREIVGSLPALGATVGGALASPGVVTTPAGAAVGAGLGEAARQTITHWFPNLGSAPKGTADALMETVKQMGLGGASEAAGPYLDNLFKMTIPALKASAKKSLISVMNPTDKYAKGHALEAADELLKGPAFGEKGYVSLSRKSLENKAGKNLASVGKQIENAEAPIGRNQIAPQLVSDLESTLDAYENSMYMPPKQIPGQNPTVQAKYGHEPNLKALADIRQHLENEMTPGPNGTSNISRESLRLVRQNVDKAVRRSEGFARGALAAGGAVEPALASKLEVEKDAGNIFRKILNEDNPDIAKLNAEYHLWSSVKDAMSPATLQKQFDKKTSPWQQLWHDRYAVWLAGAGASGAAGHYGGANAAEATGALFAVGMLMKSAAWKTTSAATKTQLAEMLAKGQLEGAAKLATRVAIQKNTTTPPPQASSTVKMKAPDGTIQDVPKDQAEHYKSKGATVVQ